MCQKFCQNEKKYDNFDNFTASIKEMMHTMDLTVVSIRRGRDFFEVGRGVCGLLRVDFGARRHRRNVLTFHQHQHNT